MQRHPNDGRRLLTASEVAAQLGVRTAFVYDLARRHLLPVIHVGRYCRFDPATIARWLEAGGASTDAPAEWEKTPRALPGHQKSN